MPAVTVCVNNPMRWNESLGPETLEVMSAVTNDFTFDIKQMSYQKLSQTGDKLIEVLAKLNESERYKLGFNRTDFLLGCKNGDQSCNDTDFLDFNNLFFGNCFTYNSGLPSLTTKTISRDKDLVMVFRTKLGDAAPFLVRDEGLVMRLHMPKTPPVLHQSQLTAIYPECWVRMPLTVKYFQRLPSPYTSMCIDDDEPSNSFSRSLERPYIYSSEDCTENCIQNRSLENCQCFDPKFAISHDLATNADVCNDTQRCNLTAAHAQVCNCQKSCSEVIYEFRADVDDRWLEQDVWQMWVTDFLAQPDCQKWKTTEYAMSGIEMYLASSIIERFSEEEKITLSDFLAAIGGNLGLWVGISVISLAEVCEIIFFISIELLMELVTKLKNISFKNCL